MRDKEIQLFTDAISQASQEFYLDAVSLLNELINEFQDSELVDDAYYNIGLCYFNMNQFEKAIKMFEKVIQEYPEGTISILNGGNEYGHTAAKCWLAIMNCFLGLGSIEKAKDTIKNLSQFDDSYLMVENGEKITFEQLAIMSLDKFLNQKNK